MVLLLQLGHRLDEQINVVFRDEIELKVTDVDLAEWYRFVGTRLAEALGQCRG